jgi:hypothetical protein
MQEPPEDDNAPEVQCAQEDLGTDITEYDEFDEIQEVLAHGISSGGRLFCTELVNFTQNICKLHD